MILGVLPLFIVLDLRASAAVLGLIEGTSEAVNYLFRIFAGMLTDRLGRRKPLVLLGYGLSAVAKPFFALATSWEQAFAVRVTDRAGKGTRTSPRDALISDSIPKSQAGKGFGLHRSLDQIGAVLGPLVAFAAVPLIGIRGVFWLSFVPGVAGVLVLMFLVKDSYRRPLGRGVLSNARDVMTKEYAAFLVVVGIFGIGAYNFSFVLLKASALGVNTNDISLVYALLNLATVLIGFPAGLLADRVGKFPVLMLSFVLFLAGSLASYLLSNYWAFAFLIAFLFGSYLSVSDTVQRAIVPDLTGPSLKGTAYAIYYTLIGFSSLAANAVIGIMWTTSGPNAAFEYSVVTSFLGILALCVFILVRRAGIL